jgi:hypothetical protein
MWALSALCAFHWTRINCTIINIKVYIFTLLVISIIKKLIKYHTAISSTMIHNNEKKTTEMTTVYSKLMITNLD